MGEWKRELGREEVELMGWKKGRVGGGLGWECSSVEGGWEGVDKPEGGEMRPHQDNLSRKHLPILAVLSFSSASSRLLAVLLRSSSSFGFLFS